MPGLILPTIWSVFGTLLVVLLIVIGVGIVLGMLATPIGDGEAATYVASTMYFDLGGAAASTAAPTEPVQDGL